MYVSTNLSIPCLILFTINQILLRMLRVCLLGNPKLNKCVNDLSILAFKYYGKFHFCKPMSKKLNLLSWLMTFMNRSWFALACLVRINRIRVGLKQISLLANSSGKFLATFAISLIDVFTICLRMESIILFVNKAIRWKLFFPSYLSGNNTLSNLPLSINQDSRRTLSRMFCSHQLDDLPSLLILSLLEWKGYIHNHVQIYSID